MIAVLIVLAVFLIIGSLIAVFWPKYIPSERGEGGAGTYEPTVRWNRTPLVALAVALAIFFVGSPVQVEPSERGVVVRLGAVTGEVFAEGLHFKTPLLESVQIMDTQVHAHKVTAQAASKDLQDVSTEVTLNYFLRPDTVARIYQTLRRDFIVRIIDPSIQEAVKAITAKNNAEQLITERSRVRDEIDTLLDLRLEEHGIVVEQINITDFDFSTIFNASIEAKVTAQQDAQRAQNELQRIVIEAEQARARAAGLRDATIAQANGQAEATLVNARAQAEANRLLTESLSDQLIQYTTVAKLADDIRVIVLPTGQQFILGEQVIR